MVAVRAMKAARHRPSMISGSEGFVGVIRQMRVMDDNDEGDDTGKGRGFRDL